MNRLFRLIQKEFAQIRHDPKMFGIMFIAPVIQLIIIGYAATTDVNNINLGICDLDHSVKSRQLINSFTSSNYFRLYRYVSIPSKLDISIASGDVNIALVIPEHFAKDLELKKQTNVQLLVDGSDATTATVALGYAKTVIQQFMKPYFDDLQNKLKIRNIRLPSVNVAYRALFNPELKSKVYMVPAGLGTVLMIVMIILTAMALVKEREIGTLEQLIVTPLKKWELLLGKILPFVFIGIFTETLVILVAVYIFKIPLKGNLLTLYLLSFGFFFTTLGLGILVSTVSRTQQQAMLITAFFVIMPFIYLSGFVFPIANMPDLIQIVTYAIPLRYYLVIVRGIFLKGTGWLELWDEFAIMVFIGIIIFSIATLRFQKKLD